MLHKYPKSSSKKFIISGVKFLIAVETLAFVGCYALWYKLNTQRDFRLYMHNNYSSVLETYYKIGEYFDTENKCRDLDRTVWQKEGKIKLISTE